MSEEELIKHVKKVIERPKQNVHELNKLHIQLYGTKINMNCSDCIHDAVISLNAWLRSKNQQQSINYQELMYRTKLDICKINLFVQVYDCGIPERQHELDACLRLNKENKLFDNIIQIKERLNIREMFDMAKQYPDHINVFSNSDIYFDETLIWARLINEDECYALSRWDYTGDKTACLFNRKDSQDVWIFKGVPNQFIKANYKMGIPGVDNRIAWDIKDAGYKVKNPSKTIHAIHLHTSNHRTYNQNTARIEEPYHFVEPKYI